MQRNIELLGGATRCASTSYILNSNAETLAKYQLAIAWWNE